METDPDIINIIDDWDSLLGCKEQQLSNLLTVLALIDEGKIFLDKTANNEKFMEALKDEEKDHVFDFQKQVNEDFEALTTFYQEVRENLVGLCKYLGIKVESDFDGRQPQDLFNKTMFNFGRMLQFAAKEKEKLLALDQMDEDYVFLDFENS
eukprot:TRINITY_DN31310_c0_g1_i1.p2 TRINITY_DN31310_c0_g1~~TRINITY_DN31310_c0_g1_i1.p2  ORF type:complete len:152 (+),score=33.67 TRINITY_DN31310_c0_g1_i1:1-456(+)